MAAILSDVARVALEFENEIDDANGTATSHEPRCRRLLRIRQFENPLRIDRRHPIRRLCRNRRRRARGVKHVGYGRIRLHAEKEHRDDDIPTRGVATFCGDTVAMAQVSTGETVEEPPKLYAGKLELVASFSKT